MQHMDEKLGNCLLVEAFYITTRVHIKACGKWISRQTRYRIISTGLRFASSG